MTSKPLHYVIRSCFIKHYLHLNCCCHVSRLYISEPTTTPRIEVTKSSESVIVNNGKRLNIILKYRCLASMCQICTAFPWWLCFKNIHLCGTYIYLAISIFCFPNTIKWKFADENNAPTFVINSKSGRILPL